MVTATDTARERPGIAFLFPGQGSQRIGMGKALADAFAIARAVYQEADDVLGMSLSRLCFEGPEEELTLTANAQPAILATSIAALRVLKDETPWRATVVAGHSLGEYSALVSAGALSLADALRLVRLRGQFMQEAVPAGIGAMAAIMGLTPAEVEGACQEAMQEGKQDAMQEANQDGTQAASKETMQGGTPEPSPNAVRAREREVVSPANLNGGGQIVIAGHKAAVDRACAAAKRRGAKRAIPLTVSAPFHSALMQPAADRLAAALQQVEVRDPVVPVLTNVEANVNLDGSRVRDLLRRQVTAAVRWEESMQRLGQLNVGEAIEVGHGSVLAGLLKRIAPTIRVRGAGDPEAIAALGQAGSTGAMIHG